MQQMISDIMQAYVSMTLIDNRRRVAFKPESPSLLVQTHTTYFLKTLCSKCNQAR